MGTRPHVSRDAVLDRQRALARVLTDADLRRAVLADGGSGDSAEPDIDGAWVRALPRKRVETVAQLLVINRLTKAMEGLPLTTALLGAHLWQLTVQYAQSVPPRVAKKHAEALSFARFVRARFAELPEPTSLLDDALSYETAVLEVQFAPASGGTWTSDTHEALASESLACISPRRLPHQRVISVHHDLEAVSEAVDKGEGQPAPAQRAMMILLYRDRSGTFGQAEITRPTAAFLAACDGTASLEDVIGQLASELGQDEHDQGFRDKCVQICESLCTAGILTLSRVPRAPDR